MSEREPMMCVACGTVLGCDCTRMGTGTQDHRTVADAHYEAGRAEGMREAARIAETALVRRYQNGRDVGMTRGCIVEAILSAIGEKPHE